MTRSFAVGAGLLALLASGLPARAGSAEEPLRWKFQAGQVLRYEFRQKNEIKLKGGAQSSDNTTELTIEMTWTVKDVQDAVAELKLVVDRVLSEIQIGAQKIKYDSREAAGDDPAAKALSAVYSAAVGQDYALKVDTRGRVVEATVPAKVTEALRGSPFLAAADGGSVLSEKGLKNLFAQVIPPLPEEPVEKNARWTTSLDLPVKPMKMSLTFKDTLAARDDATARFDAEIVTTIEPEPDTPFKVTVKKQSGSRTATLDTKAGRMTGSAIKQTIELGLEFMNREIEQVIALDEQMKLIP
jgi:hypothetical protein